MSTINRETYYIALGLYHLASRAREDLETYEEALHNLLGGRDGDHISDACFGERDFDEALSLSGISVEPPEDAD